MDEIRDYIDRAKSAQQAHDERPGTQLAMLDLADEDLFRCDLCGRISDIENSVRCGKSTLVCEHCHNADSDPGDCTDHRGE